MGIDRTRVYATGISNGGVLAYALACNTHARGNVYYSCCAAVVKL